MVNPLHVLCVFLEKEEDRKLDFLRVLGEMLCIPILPLRIIAKVAKKTGVKNTPVCKYYKLSLKSFNKSDSSTPNTFAIADSSKSLTILTPFSIL